MRGGTRKRGGTWTWHLGVADPATGRWRQLTKGGFRTRREAQAALNEAMAALRAGTFVAPSRLTLGAFLTEQWLPTVRRRPTDHLDDLSHLRRGSHHPGARPGPPPGADG
jgi:hypothetical protein